MNEYRIRESGQVLSESEFRTLHANVSFPPVIDAPTLAAYGADPVLAAPAPAVTAIQDAVRNGVVLDGLGNWVHAYTVTDWSAERVAAFMSTQIAAAVERTYRDVDAVYDAAVGSRTSEYALAEEAALAYQAAGYQGPVSGFVSGYAASNPTGQAQSNQWAADSIIARSVAMRGAQLAMRNTRFTCQAGMRAATTPAQLATAVATWNGFMAVVRSQLGI